MEKQNLTIIFNFNPELDHEFLYIIKSLNSNILILIKNIEK